MPRGRSFVIVLSVAGLIAFLSWAFLVDRSTAHIYEPPSRRIEVASPCPWRNADGDLTNWFPGATGYAIRDVPLSGKRVALQERLGRTLQPDEMALHLYVVSSNKLILGTVLTRRIKGTHGAVEFALGLNARDEVQHFKIQRIREPEELVQALDSANLEQVFKGRTLANFSQAPIPKTDQPLLQEIVNGVRTSLVLYEGAQATPHLKHH